MTELPVFLAAAALLFPAGISLAQAPPKPPEPGPEQKRLNYFVGMWSFRLSRATPGSSPTTRRSAGRR